MEFPEFVDAVLQEVGALDATESADGEDTIAVEQAFTRITATLRARDILQTVVRVNQDIRDAMAAPLIKLIAYEIAPAYGYPRSEATKINAEENLHEVTRTIYRSEPLRNRHFL